MRKISLENPFSKSSESKEPEKQKPLTIKGVEIKVGDFLTFDSTKGKRITLKVKEITDDKIIFEEGTYKTIKKLEEEGSVLESSSTPTKITSKISIPDATRKETKKRADTADKPAPQPEKEKGALPMRAIKNSKFVDLFENSLIVRPNDLLTFSSSSSPTGEVTRRVMEVYNDRLIFKSKDSKGRDITSYKLIENLKNDPNLDRAPEDRPSHPLITKTRKFPPESREKMKSSFAEIAKRIAGEGFEPMSENEIWKYTEKYLGKDTPQAILNQNDKMLTIRAGNCLYFTALDGKINENLEIKKITEEKIGIIIVEFTNGAKKTLKEIQDDLDNKRTTVRLFLSPTHALTHNKVYESEKTATLPTEMPNAAKKPSFIFNRGDGPRKIQVGGVWPILLGGKGGYKYLKIERIDGDGNVFFYGGTKKTVAQIKEETSKLLAQTKRLRGEHEPTSHGLPTVIITENPQFEIIRKNRDGGAILKNIKTGDVFSITKEQRGRFGIEPEMVVENREEKTGFRLLETLEYKGGRYRIEGIDENTGIITLKPKKGGVLLIPEKVLQENQDTERARKAVSTAQEAPTENVVILSERAKKPGLKKRSWLRAAAAAVMLFLAAKGDSGIKTHPIPEQSTEETPETPSPEQQEILNNADETRSAVAEAVQEARQIIDKGVKNFSNAVDSLGSTETAEETENALRGAAESISQMRNGLERANTNFSDIVEQLSMAAISLPENIIENLGEVSAEFSRSLEHADDDIARLSRLVVEKRNREAIKEELGRITGELTKHRSDLRNVATNFFDLLSSSYAKIFKQQLSAILFTPETGRHNNAEPIMIKER